MSRYVGAGRKKDPGAWLNTPKGQARYTERRAEAQTLANTTGFDYSLVRNDIFQDFTVHMLPRRENRYGRDLEGEVVMCEHIDRCQPGHGPCR